MIIKIEWNRYDNSKIVCALILNFNQSYAKLRTFTYRDASDLWRFVFQKLVTNSRVTSLSLIVLSLLVDFNPLIR